MWTLFDGLIAVCNQFKIALLQVYRRENIYRQGKSTFHVALSYNLRCRPPSHSFFSIKLFHQSNQFLSQYHVDFRDYIHQGEWKKDLEGRTKK